MTGTPEEEELKKLEEYRSKGVEVSEITWDDIPVGTLFLGLTSCLIKWGLERGYCQFFKGKYTFKNGRMMHGSRPFYREHWDEVSFMPKEFLE